MDPCGVPLITCDHSLLVTPIFTLCFLRVKNLLSIDMRSHVVRMHFIYLQAAGEVNNQRPWTGL